MCFVTNYSDLLQINDDNAKLWFSTETSNAHEELTSNLLLDFDNNEEV